MPRTAIVLSGGAGVRLRPITQELPKGLVKVGGKPLLQWIIEWLKSYGISDIVIGVAYLKEKIIAFFKDGRDFGVNIRYSVHTVNGGTGEGFRLAIQRYADQRSFFALNGDQITDLNLMSMFRTHRKGRPIATVAAVHPRLPFGLVMTDARGYCKGFLEKPVLKSITCSSGIYLFEKDILQYLPVKGDIEKTTLPRITAMNLLKVHIHRGQFLTVNTLKELDEAKQRLEEMYLR
jgi:mannose-1-phosphate guanylyltransferase